MTGLPTVLDAVGVAVTPAGAVGDPAGVSGPDRIGLGVVDGPGDPDGDGDGEADAAAAAARQSAACWRRLSTILSASACEAAGIPCRTLSWANTGRSEILTSSAGSSTQARCSGPTDSGRPRKIATASRRAPTKYWC